MREFQGPELPALLLLLLAAALELRMLPVGSKDRDD